MNSSDRIINNLKVLREHGIMIQEERNIRTCTSTYNFEVSDFQLSKLNITDVNDIYMDGMKPGDVFVRKSAKRIIEEICQKNPKDNANDYKNKPYLRSDYMSNYDITKVEVLNDRVVIMRFGDGSFTKAVCTEDDAKNGKFDVDMGITICLIKKILGEADGKKKAYAKLIHDIHKMMDEQDKQTKEEEQRKANAKARKLRKAQRRAAAAKQENDEFRNDMSDAILYALERLEMEKRMEEQMTESEPEKVD